MTGMSDGPSIAKDSESEFERVAKRDENSLKTAFFSLPSVAFSGEILTCPILHSKQKQASEDDIFFVINRLNRRII